MFTRNIKIIALLSLFLLPALACNLPSSETPDTAATFNPLYTAAAQTLEAMATQSGSTPVAPTSTLSLATATLFVPSATPYQSPVPVKRCDAAAFIRDITIPDGTLLEHDEDFTKTWRFQNVGTCTWTSSYALVFFSGDGLSAPVSVNLNRTVYPGEQVDLSVNMVAPNKNGHFRGYWKFRNAAGALFGIGAQADTAFWVDINVTGPSYVFYDFTNEACNAEWRNNNGALPCPGTEGDDEGYVISISSPRMENGAFADDHGLLTVPEHASDGYIRGKYPSIKIKNGDHFKALINCQYNASSCNVIFRLDYRAGDGAIKTLNEWQEVYEGQYYSVDVDLSPLAGENVKFFLTVLANTSKNKNYALWIYPRIMRNGTPPPTFTPTPTSTATFTPTATSTFTPTATATPTDTPTDTPTATATP